MKVKVVVCAGALLLFVGVAIASFMVGMSLKPEDGLSVILFMVGGVSSIAAFMVLIVTLVDLSSVE